MQPTTRPQAHTITMPELIDHINLSNRRLIIFEHMMRTADTPEQRDFARQVLNDDVVPGIYNAFVTLNQLAGQAYVNVILLPRSVEDARFYYLVNLNRQLQGLPIYTGEEEAPRPQPTGSNEPGI
jgi:hypothetical protein